MIELGLRRHLTFPKNITFEDFGAFRLGPSRIHNEMTYWFKCVRKWSEHTIDEELENAIFNAWKKIYAIRPVFEGHVTKVTGQHLRLENPRQFQDRQHIIKTVSVQDEIVPMLVHVPDGMFVATYEFTRTTQHHNADHDELHFWMWMIRGYDFAKQQSLHWWWPSIIPNHERGFCSDCLLNSVPLPDYSKRGLSFVFESETDAILFSAYMDTIKDHKLAMLTRV